MYLNLQMLNPKEETNTSHDLQPSELNLKQKDSHYIRFIIIEEKQDKEMKMYKVVCHQSVKTSQ